MMPVVAKIGTEYLLFGGAGLISVLAFAALILVPALGSFGRTWEKATAVLLSLFVLVALLRSASPWASRSSTTGTTSPASSARWRVTVARGGARTL